MKYRIISNDGRYVSQSGTVPILTNAPALAYVWDTEDEAQAILPKYAEALEGSGALALAVKPVPEEDESSNAVLENAGFKLAQHQWLRPDPRGFEYGCFLAQQIGRIIQVTHQRDGYSMTFQTAQSFTNWAKANCL